MGKYLMSAYEGKDALNTILEAEGEIARLKYDLEGIILYAFRYTLGRSSYSVSDMCVTISKYKDVLGTTMSLIKKETQEYLDNSPQGHTREWQDLLKELNNDPKGYSMSTLETFNKIKET